MPPQRKVSGLMAKYGAKLDQAAKKSADNPIDYGNEGLPYGIPKEIGIAQLVECKFDTYKTGDYQGEYYFQARGVILEPEYHTTPDGVEHKVRGRQTMIQEAVCDTKTQAGKVTTQEEHIAKILNHMKLLANDESYTKGVGGSELESLAEGLKEAAPYFRFSTAPRYDQNAKGLNGEKVVTGSWENWHGGKGLEDYVPGDATADAVEDESQKAAPTKAPPSAKPVAKTAPATKAQLPAKKPAPGPEPQFDETNGDLDSLVAAADEGDLAAAGRLKEMALESGVDEESIDAATSWGEVVELMSSVTPGADTEVVEEEATYSVGDVYNYKPLDPKTKKRSAKAVNVEILEVDEENKTVTLKDLSNPN